MSKKKSKKTEKEQPEVNMKEIEHEERTDKPAVDVADENAEDKADKSVELELQLKKQMEELRETNLRLHAEFDNYRKRSIKEKIELSKTASEEVIIDLLPVLDDFERALKNLNKDSKDAFNIGVELIYSKLLKTLLNKGLEEIQAMGQTFDTDYHEAVSHMPAGDENQKNKIIDVVLKGYKLHGKVIRFAKVVVAS